MSEELTLHAAALRLVELSWKIERVAKNEEEENDLCNQRDRLLAMFREADRRSSPREWAAVVEECAKIAEADYTPAYGPHSADMESLALRQRQNIAQRIRYLSPPTKGEG